MNAVFGIWAPKNCDDLADGHALFSSQGPLFLLDFAELLSLRFLNGKTKKLKTEVFPWAPGCGRRNSTAKSFGLLSDFTLSATRAL